MKSYINSEIGQRIKSARISKGLTQQQLAEELNFSKSYIRKFEQGIRMPNIINLIAISYVLEVDPGFFLTNIDSKEAYDTLLTTIRKE